MSTHHIIKIERGITKHGDPMWRCTTQEGVRVNIFPASSKSAGTLHLFDDYYPELNALKTGAALHWRLHPIACQLDTSGQWASIVSVAPRPPGAIPDPVLQPDRALIRKAIQHWWARLETRRQHQNIVIWDTETTGPDAAVDQIISIGAVTLDGETVLDTLIQPKNPELLTPEATAVHGITQKHLADAPTFAEAYSWIHNAFKDATWVIYNAPFDTTVLSRDCMRWHLPPIYGLGVLDAMPLAAEWMGDWNEDRQQFVNKKLADVALELGIDAEGAHDALTDARLTLQVLRAIGQTEAEQTQNKLPF